MESIMDKHHARAVSRLINTLRELKYYGLEADYLCGIYHDISDSILDLLEVPRTCILTPNIREPYYSLFDTISSDMDLTARIEDLRDRAEV
jgi:hypothetical protein